MLLLPGRPLHWSKHGQEAGKKASRSARAEITLKQWPKRVLQIITDNRERVIDKIIAEEEDLYAELGVRVKACPVNHRLGHGCAQDDDDSGGAADKKHEEAEQDSGEDALMLQMLAMCPFRFMEKEIQRIMQDRAWEANCCAP